MFRKRPTSSQPPKGRTDQNSVFEGRKSSKGNKGASGEGNVEQMTLPEFREEQKKSYIVKFKEEDDDEYDTYEMFHYSLAENNRKRQSPQNLRSNV